MVRKEEIVGWFSRQPSHQRLDVLCTLASKCLPLELRFLNTCVDFLTRNKTPSARDAEILAALEKNCLQLNEVDLHDEGSRRKLILALTLLHAGNRIVANTIYRILCSTFSDLKVFGLDITMESSLELHLIFTMALHHPSFTYEEKEKLGDIYLCMQSRLPGLRPISDSVSPVPASTPSPQPQSSPPDISERSLNNGSNSSSSSSSSNTSTNSNSRVKTVQNDRATLRRNRNSPKSNGSVMVDSVTTHLKEQLGKDRLPKCWKQFEHHNPAELMKYSDQEFLNYGLNSNFISQLRKVLNQYHHKSNGLVIPNEETKAVQQVNNKSTTSTASRSNMVKTCMGPPNVQPAFNNSQRLATTATDHQQSLHQQHHQQHQQHHQQQQQQHHQQQQQHHQQQQQHHQQQQQQQQHHHQQQQQHHHHHQQYQQQQQQHQQYHQQQQLLDPPTSRAGSSSSSGSSSLETCSPPSSPTDSSSTAQKDNHRKHYPVPQTMMVLNPGTRPQSRVPSSSTVTSSTLRGANNIGFPRPISTTSNSSAGPNRQQQQQPLSTATSRAASQPREMSFPVSLSYAVPAQQQVVPPPPASAQSTSFIVDSSTPPPHLEAQAAVAQTQQPVQSPATLSVYSYGYMLPNGDATPPFPQPPFTFITSGPPPNSSGMPGNSRPPGPHHDMIYSPQSYVIQGQVVAQPLGSHHGSSANGRSLMELPYLPPGAIYMTRSDQATAVATDYSRPPPPGSQSSASGPSPIPGNNSCFNCGASGHRGTQCQQITFDEIINPSPA